MPRSVPNLPLFHPRTVSSRLRAHSDPPDFQRRHDVVLRWIRLHQEGRLRRSKEKNLQSQFLERVFGDVLGYRSATNAPGDAWDLTAEQQMGRGAADAALGLFRSSRPPVIIAPVELKGPKQGLDHALGRALTPVQQAWNYANHAPSARWIIASNFVETRLYSKARSPDYFERFHLEELASPTAFRRFCYLLGRANLLPPAAGQPSVLDELLLASERDEQEITGRLYRDYRALRVALFEELRATHGDLAPHDLLRSAQTILDRILFIAFAEDRQLLPDDTIARAADAGAREGDAWVNFRRIFQWIDVGNLHQKFPPYNGGLFRADPTIDSLEVSNVLCERFKDLAKYDFSEDVSVEVLGHIFEQSVADLEELRAEALGQSPSPATSRRRVEGVFYTPSAITRFIAEETIGRVLKDRYDVIFAPASLKGTRNQLLAWEAYRESLKQVRILDPACGSGAFLIAAYDLLAREYERVNAALAELRGSQIGLFDLTRTILNNNLFGVDLNGESVEITKLSLWLKTAEQRKKLTYLDSNIKAGNSVVDDPVVDPRAFDWATGSVARPLLEPAPEETAPAIEALWRDGFDVVLGNPPYVRHELLKAVKPHLSKRFRVYDGQADLFVYFFERALSVLKPGGRLGLICANKWFKAGYAQPLRRVLSSEVVLERLVDFGHAPIFPDADAFPSVVVLRKPPAGEVPTENAVAVTKFPRESLETSGVGEYVRQHAFPLRQSELSEKRWVLEPPEVRQLLKKIRSARTTVKSAVGMPPLRGLMTGFNPAYVLSDEERRTLVRHDSRAESLLRPYLPGAGVNPWCPAPSEQWFLALGSSDNIAWPWKGLTSAAAERCFQETFPGVYSRMKAFERQLKARTDQGPNWWELRSCAYYEHFEQARIVYPDIMWTSSFCLAPPGLYFTNSAYFLTSGDPWLLAVLNSPAIWAWGFRELQHGKDEALRFFTEDVDELPVAEPKRGGRSAAEKRVANLSELLVEETRVRAAVHSSLRLQFGLGPSIGNRLERFESLTGDALVQEVLKRRGRRAAALRPSEIAELQRLVREDAACIRTLQQTALEQRMALADLVHDAFRLTTSDLRLLWRTAPPRMPFDDPRYLPVPSHHQVEVA